jgi:hypothetical protein
MRFSRIASRISGSKTSVFNVGPFEESDDAAIDRSHEFFVEFPPHHTFDFGGYKILERYGSYSFCVEKDGKLISVGKLDLEKYRDGHQVKYITTKRSYRGKQLGRTMYDFALTLGPVYSDIHQTPDSIASWYRMLKDGYNIELFDPQIGKPVMMKDPKTGKPVKVPLFPDSSEKAVSSGSPDHPVYRSGYLLKLSA